MPVQRTLEPIFDPGLLSNQALAMADQRPQFKHVQRRHPDRWGPKADTLQAALTMMGEVVASGARGATIGRNVWGFENVTAAVQAFKAVIHEGKPACEVY
jgi:hypothetical protein